MSFHIFCRFKLCLTSVEAVLGHVVVVPGRSPVLEVSRWWHHHENPRPLHSGDVGVGCYGVSFIVIYELILCCFFFGWDPRLARFLCHPEKTTITELGESLWNEVRDEETYGIPWGRFELREAQNTQMWNGAQPSLVERDLFGRTRNTTTTSQNGTKQQIIFSKSNLWQLMASKWMAPKLRVAVWDSSILSSLSG